MHDVNPNKRLDRLFPTNPARQGTIYRIGDLAREFDVTLRTLRFYEDRGLIQPKRQGTTRLYSEDDRARLKVILLAKQVGFSLVEIEDVLRIFDRYEDFDDPIGDILGKLTGQMEVLRSQKAEIEEAMEKLANAIRSLKEY